MSVLAKVSYTYDSRRSGAAVDAGEAKGHDLQARFVPSIIPYKDYSEDQEDESEDKKLKTRFVPSIIPYKDYSEDQEDEDA